METKFFLEWFDKRLFPLGTFMLLFTISYTPLISQTISGSFSQLSGAELQLGGFEGFNDYNIAKTTTDENGAFEFRYSAADYGVGFLMGSDQKPLFVILSGEDVEIQGELPSLTETVEILEGKENTAFAQYASEHPRREQALSAWLYLERFYREDSLFAAQKRPQEAIQREKRRIKEEDSAFIAGLPDDSYVKWYLPVRKLVSSVSAVAQHRPQEVPEFIEGFRKLDYTDERLYKSGLLKDAVENHFWLIENSGNPLDTVYSIMNSSIDYMVENLAADEEKFNEITDFLFDLLERHSLFDPAEYLALKVLNETSCTIDESLAKQLETYRAMKKGKVAADIEFAGDILAPGSHEEVPNSLSDINSEFTVVVFGSSWCGKCRNEIPKIAEPYPTWKEQDVEVVFISLDDNKKAFDDFAGDFPFISMCDYQKWESTPVVDYYVFSTPTMFLLDRNRKIVLRPKSIQQMDAWVDWFLVKGNPFPD